MNKNFTKEDILKKHETNIKSAGTAIFLSGVLGLIYVVRYFFTGNFDFYFSLSFTDMILKAGHEKGSIILPAVVSVAFIAAYTFLAVLSSKNAKVLSVALGAYLFDFLCLLACILFLWEKPIAPECFIDVIVHLFVAVFLFVGIRSERAMRNN